MTQITTEQTEKLRSLLMQWLEAAPVENLAELAAHLLSRYGVSVADEQAATAAGEAA